MNRQPDHRLHVIGPSQKTNWDLISAAISEHWQSIQKSVQMFIIQLGLSSERRVVESLAEDILNDVVTTAFKIADKYDPAYPARPWLRQIAFNKVREHRRKCYRDRGKVIAIADVPQVRRAQSQATDPLSEDEMFGLIDRSVEASDLNSPSLDELLTLVSENDRQTLKLAFADGLRGKELAAALGIREGAANTRLSRAIDRLHKAYVQSASTFRRSQDA